MSRFQESNIEHFAVLPALSPPTLDTGFDIKVTTALEAGCLTPFQTSYKTRGVQPPNGAAL